MQYSARVWNDDRQTGNAYTDTIAQGTWDATDYQPGAAGILAALPGGTVGRQWGARYGLRSHRGRPPQRMIADHLDAFERIFPGSRSHDNGRAFFVWSAGDPYGLGAYSYLAVGQYTAFNGIQGRREGRLHSPGSRRQRTFRATSRERSPSGYRCADEVVADPM